MNGENVYTQQDLLGYLEEVEDILAGIRFLLGKVEFDEIEVTEDDRTEARRGLVRGKKGC